MECTWLCGSGSGSGYEMGLRVALGAPPQNHVFGDRASFVNCVHTVHNSLDVTPNTVHTPVHAPVHCKSHWLATSFRFCSRGASVLFPFLGECSQMYFTLQCTSCFHNNTRHLISLSYLKAEESPNHAHDYSVHRLGARRHRSGRSPLSRLSPSLVSAVANASRRDGQQNG